MPFNFITKNQLYIYALKNTASQIEDKQGTSFDGHGIGATESLQSTEIYFSTTCSVSLNALLSPCKNISVIHQAPIRKKVGAPGNPEAADLGAIRLTPKSRCQTVFILSSASQESI